MSESLADALLREQARVRGLLESAIEIGPNGAFAALMYRRALERAEKAVASDDVLEMCRACEGLRGCS